MAEIPHVQNPVIEYGKANRWLVRRLRWLGRVAAPDTIFAKGGIVLWVEFKDEKKRPGLMQKREHARMRDAGMLTFVIDNVAAGRALLDRYDPDDI